MWNARDCGSARAHALEDDLPRTPSDISAFPSFQLEQVGMSLLSFVRACLLEIVLWCSSQSLMREMY